MHEIDPEDLRCKLDCCAEEYTTELELKKAKELLPYQQANEQVYEMDDDIRVFLFDIPKGQYAKRTMIAATFAVCNVVLGAVCTLCFMFPFEGAYANFARTLHVPLSTLGMIYHATPGMMALCKFYDSSHVLKWEDRRMQHVLQMLVAFMFLSIGLGIFEWEADVDYDTFHAVIGIGAVLANLLVFVTGGLACMGSVPGPKHSRGHESFMANIHAYMGIATYATFIVTFATGFTGPFKLWLESVFGHLVCLWIIGLTIFLFVITLIGPYLRFKANRDKEIFERKVKKRKKLEEKDKKRKDKLARLGYPPEGLK